MTLYFRGRPCCSCQIDFLTDFEAKRGRGRDTYYQLIGYAPQSAGTHGSGGCDDTPTKSRADLLLSRQMGGWGSNRTTAQGFSMYHSHRVIFGCPHMEPGAKYQESELRAGRNGLVSRARDNGPRPAKIVTYAQWKKDQIKQANKPHPDGEGRLVIGGKEYTAVHSLSSYWINKARLTKRVSRFAYWMQVLLRRLGYYWGPLDGIYGPVTDAARANYRAKKLKWKPNTQCSVVFLHQLVKDANSKLKVIEK